MDGGVFLDEPCVPLGTSATALVIRRSEVSVEANIMKSPQIWCSIRGPSGATPKDVFLGFSGNGVWSKIQIAGINQCAAEGATL